MRDKAHFEILFSQYPDLVKLPQLQQMLGGISDKLVRSLLKKNHIKHFYIRGGYVIPKACVIDYLLSDHYFEYHHRLTRWGKEQ